MERENKTFKKAFVSPMYLLHHFFMNLLLEFTKVCFYSNLIYKKKVKKILKTVERILVMFLFGSFHILMS